MGQEREKKGARTSLERGKKRVGTGAKWVFNSIKNGISLNSRIWNGEERPFFIVPHLSSRFLAVPPLFHPFFMILARNGKKGCPKMEERERKERVPFLFLSRSHFLPFLAWHISSAVHFLVSGLILSCLVLAILAFSYPLSLPF